MGQCGGAVVGSHRILLTAKGQGLKLFMQPYGAGIFEVHLYYFHSVATPRYMSIPIVVR